jgi:hypothetical protein
MTMHQHNHHHTADWHAGPHNQHARNFRAHTRRPITPTIRDTDLSHLRPRPSPVTLDSPSPRANLNRLVRGMGQ